VEAPLRVAGSADDPVEELPEVEVTPRAVAPADKLAEELPQVEKPADKLVEKLPEGGGTAQDGGASR
jgi:hypothetical protein